MSDTQRLQRLISDECGDCCTGDIDERVASLRRLADEASSPELDADVEVFGALASETRYRIVRLLAAAEDELCVCEFDPLLDVSESAVSHALSKLTDAGLVTRRKDGKWRYYRSTDLAERLVGTVGQAGDDGAATVSDSTEGEP
ncbi:ArsR/SmtB family transcription factor [Haloarchaeobius sp. TZWWS8]|uniref:ArsR/SmtB family transcription factor n=1 Tax=Haloarchaeobius sp. TZWWS8 TaxID=3446121 RepID=UPI003EBE076B